MSVVIPTANNLILKIEDGFTTTGPELMVNAGDHKIFNSTAVIFSLCGMDENNQNRKPVVIPDGLKNGCLVVPSLSGLDNSIDIYAGTIILGGNEIAIPAVTDLSATRPSTGKMKTVSVVVDNAGNISLLDGLEHTSLNEIRGANGGSAFVPIGNVELAHINLSTSTPAPLLDEETIFKPELTSMPEFEIEPYTAQIVFKKPLDLIHVASVPKNVYITFCEPQTIQIDPISFTPPTDTTTYMESTGSITENGTGLGTLLLHLSAIELDFVRRIDGTVRFIEFMPDSNGTRKELYFARIETSATYTPGEQMSGNITLVPIEKPKIEIV